MVTLEQVKLLESKVGKALAYIDALSAENSKLQEKLDSYRSRIDELESVVLAFKEEQGRIEAGIISALDRLNQFEDAVERGKVDVKTEIEPAVTLNSPAPVESEEIASPAAENPIEDDLAAEGYSLEPELDEPETGKKTGELDIF